MDLQTLQSRVAELIGNDTTAMQTKIKNWLNFVQRDMCHNIRFDKLKGHVEVASNSGAAGLDGQYYYNLPTDLDQLVVIVWQGDVPRELGVRNVEDYHLQVPHVLTANDQGEPEYYVLPGGEQFFVYPKYNQALAVKNFHVHYYKQPTDMANPTDLPSIPSRYHHELIWGAFYWGRQYEQDAQGVQLAVQDYQNTVRRVRQAERRNQRYNRGMSSIQDLRTVDEW